MLWLLPALVVASIPSDLKLVGIVERADASLSAAILASAGRERVVTVGETAFGGRLASIAAGLVTLRFGEQDVQVRLADEAPLAKGPANVTPVAAARPARPSRTGRVMARAEVERRLGQEMPRILAETALVAAREAGGRVAGYTLSRVAENSLLTDAGLRPGDVITEVNGTPIDSLATLASLYPRLAVEKELRAVVLRDGQPVPLSITLR